MFSNHAAQRLRKWILASGAGCLLACGTPANALEDSIVTGSVDLQEYYAALVEPSLADGHITDAERQAILSVAVKTLTRAQIEELERRIAEANVPSLPGAITVPKNSTKNSEGFKQAKLSESIEPEATPRHADNEGQTIDSEIESACEPCDTGLCDNLSLFGTFEGFKGPVDLGDRNGNFGVRLGFNWGYPLLEDYCLGIQIGSAVTFADFRGTQFTGDDDRIQSFTTLGLFQRRDTGINWGFGWDILNDDYYHEMNMQQFRLQVGYELTSFDEVGIWVTKGQRGDSGVVATVVTNPAPPPATITILGTEHRDPMTQANFFWRHVWPNHAATRAWIGLAEEHGEWTFGGDANIPLSDSLSLVSEAQFISPSGDSFPAGASEEIWSLSMGIAIYPGQRAMRAAHSRYAPYLPVANNGSFAVDKLPE